MDITKYFSRVGYKGCGKPADTETLFEVIHHHLMAIPFENLSVHCGEPVSLDIEIIFQKVVLQKRGGWCSELNNLLFWVLKTMGYEVSMLAAHVYQPHLDKYNPSATHLLLKVFVDCKTYIVDGAFGASSQMREPLELASGKDQPQIPGIFRLTENNGTWFFDKVRRHQMVSNKPFLKSELIDKSLYKKIYCFTLEERTIDFFCESSRFHQTSPESVMTNKSICSLQTSNGVRTLVGWTYTETIYNYQEGVDLVEFQMLHEVEKVLKEKFGIVLQSRLIVANNPGKYTI
ncbi:arylamine N-acetyltransferase, pineal gland isozyme NAT-10-like [Gastrophryne carolinensis]